MKTKYLLFFLAMNVFFSCKKDKDKDQFIGPNIDTEPNVTISHSRLNASDSTYIAPVEVNISGYASIKNSSDTPKNFTLKVNDSILTTTTTNQNSNVWQVMSNYKFNEGGLYTVTFITEFPSKVKEKTIQIKVANKIQSVKINKIKIDKLDNLQFYQPANVYFMITAPRDNGGSDLVIDTLYNTIAQPRLMVKTTDLPLIFELTDFSADLNKYKTFEVKVFHKSGGSFDPSLGTVGLSEFDYGSNAAANPYPASITRANALTNTQGTFSLEWH